MKNTKLLKDLIVELQKLEDENPGILCIVDDCEYGPDNPKTRNSLLFVDDHGDFHLLTEANIKYNNKIAVEYTQRTAVELWNTMKMPKNNFDEFEKTYNQVRDNAIECNEKFKNVVPVVVLSV